MCKGPEQTAKGVGFSSRRVWALAHTKQQATGRGFSPRGNGMRPRRETTRSRSGCAYFVSTQTADRRPFFRHERWARLMVATLDHYSKTAFILHAYVVMPDHLHLLITPTESLEKAVQFVKGGFSFRAKRELLWKEDIWQPGFSDHRVRDNQDWDRHLEYIRRNPLDAKLADHSVLYEFAGFPNSAYPQGLKPRTDDDCDVRAEARTLQFSDSPSLSTDSPSLSTDSPSLSTDSPSLSTDSPSCSAGSSSFSTDSTSFFPDNSTSLDDSEKIEHSEMAQCQLNTYGLRAVHNSKQDTGALAPEGTARISFPNTNGTGKHATQK